MENPKYSICPAKPEIENLKDNYKRMDEMVVRNFQTIYDKMDANKKEAKEDREAAQGKTDSKIDDVKAAVTGLSSMITKFVIGLISAGLLTFLGLGVKAIVDALSK